MTMEATPGKWGLTKDLARTIRGLSIDGVEAANSGHPGMPLGMADVAAVLWLQHLRHSPAHPHWPDRDRFVLSAGHGSMLIYSLLHLFGYDLPLDELRNFRQWGSKTAGHPEYHETPGVETTTGPLGQGISNAVGMALAETSLAARFNEPGHALMAHHTYVIASDGDLQEGVSHEACALAGHLKLGRLVVLYDDNQISIDGQTDLSFSEDVLGRFAAYGWHTQRIDGHDPDAIDAAILAAKAEGARPSIIACRTMIGYGSPNRGGTSKAHGEPLGKTEAVLTKEALGIPAEPTFFVPDGLHEALAEAIAAHREAAASWAAQLAAYAAAFPDKAAQFQSAWSGEVPDSALDIPAFAPGKAATRNASGDVLNAIAPHIPALLGGSADLTPSNKTFPKGETAYAPANPTGRYIHYGVREHGMAAVMNGLALHGGVIPYSGTFFVFTDYMRAAMRMAALMGLRTIYVLTHDSIGLGEDGPTHQPEAHLGSFRGMPGMVMFRPMDANETLVGWQVALRRQGPTGLVLTRQNLATFDRTALGMAPAAEAVKGGYVLMEDEGFDTILLASGSEVEIAVAAHEALRERGHRVRTVSMPSTDLFDVQPADYREAVLPTAIRRRVAIEAGATITWYKYVGLDGKAIGLDRYGASAPYERLYQEFGLTAEAVVAAVEGL